MYNFLNEYLSVKILHENDLRRICSDTCSLFLFYCYVCAIEILCENISFHERFTQYLFLGILLEIREQS